MQSEVQKSKNTQNNQKKRLFAAFGPKLISYTVAWKFSKNDNNEKYKYKNTNREGLILHRYK